MLDGMSDSIQGSTIENLHSREVDRQSPTGLIFFELSFLDTVCVYIQQMDFNEIDVGTTKAPVIFGSNLDYNIDNGYILYGSSPADDLHFLCQKCYTEYFCIHDIHNYNI